MDFIKLINIESYNFKDAWNIYEYSFPLGERRSLDAQKELLENKKYNFFSVVEDKTPVAIVASWDLDDFVFIEHFAVRKEMRGKGIGTKILKKYISAKKTKIILEVDIPETEVSIKRIKFYKNIGFCLNHFAYLQPPYKKGNDPVPMFLMTYPDKLSEVEFQLAKEKLYSCVYDVCQ